MPVTIGLVDGTAITRAKPNRKALVAMPRILSSASALNGFVNAIDSRFCNTAKTQVGFAALMMYSSHHSSNSQALQVLQHCIRMQVCNIAVRMQVWQHY